jgi:predicted permease
MRWLIRWFRRDRIDRNLDDELGFHVDAHTRDLINEGVPPDEARRRALAAFGGAAPIKELTRDAKGGRWIEDFFSDVRYAAKTLRRQPGFAGVAILTLTLGIGANTAIFSMVNAVILRKLAVPQPERLVLFSEEVQQGEHSSRPFPIGAWRYFSFDAYTFLQSQPWPMTSIAAFASGDYRTSFEAPGSSSTEPTIDVDLVSGNYFETLGASAAQGRTLTPADSRPGTAAVAVASDRFWRRVFGGDAGVVGRAVKIDGKFVTLVGVMAPDFFSARVGQVPDVWMVLESGEFPVQQRANHYGLSLIGRLAPGQTMAAAESAMNQRLRQFLASRLAAPIDAEMQRRIDGVRVVMADGSRGVSVSRAQHSRLLVLLLAAVGVILLIASGNVGTLFLTRAAAREREVAVRRALGAGRGRLVRQWLAESLLLGALGAVLGAAVAQLAAPRLLTIFVPPALPVSASTDGTVLVFTAAITVLACMLFGLAPAIRAGGVDPLAALRVSAQTGRRQRAFGMTEPFVVAQIAMSLVLVVAATLLVRTLVNLQETPYGFDQQRLLLAAINPRPGGYRAPNVSAYRGPSVGDLYRRIYDRAASLPGVESVSFAREAPFSGRTSSGAAVVDGYQPPPGTATTTQWVLVGPNYPQTIGMPVIGGRALTFDDTAGRPLVAMVNETFAKRFSPTTSPLGKFVTVAERKFEIVGVVRDAQVRGARDPVIPVAFLAMLQEPSGRILDAEFEIRTRGDAAAMAAAFRDAVAAVDSRISVYRTRTLREQVLSTFTAERTAVGFILTFALVALLVASI